MDTVPIPDEEGGQTKMQTRAIIIRRRSPEGTTEAHGAKQPCQPEEAKTQRTDRRESLGRGSEGSEDGDEETQRERSE